MQVIQGVLIVLLSMWMVLDQQGIVITTWFPIMVAFFAGLIMGDMKTAMIIGGTFQLMNLGVANIGGSSVPNWGLATVVHKWSIYRRKYVTSCRYRIIVTGYAC